MNDAPAAACHDTPLLPEIPPSHNPIWFWAGNKRNRILSYRWHRPLAPSSRGVFASSHRPPVMGLLGSREPGAAARPSVRPRARLQTTAAEQTEAQIWECEWEGPGCHPVWALPPTPRLDTPFRPGGLNSFRNTRKTQIFPFKMIWIQSMQKYFVMKVIWLSKGWCHLVLVFFSLVI